MSNSNTIESYKSIRTWLRETFNLSRRRGKLMTLMCVMLALNIVSVTVFGIINSNRERARELAAAEEERVHQELLAQAVLSAKLSPIGKMGKITVGEAFLHTEPDRESEIVTSVRKGESFKILSERSGWYLIKYSQEQSLYILTDYIRAEGLDIELDEVPEPVGINDMPIGDELYKICKEYGAAGCAIAVIKNGEVTYTYNYGYQNRALRTKVNPDTKFKCGKLSQLCTSMLFMGLEGQGRVVLDGEVFMTMGYSFINPYFPGVQITPLNLMTHTSGLRDEKLLSNGIYDVKLQTLMTRKKCYFAYEPGKVYSYSSSGFGVLGAMVEKVTDITFVDYADLIFDNLGIDASYEGANISNKDLIADCYRAGDGMTRSKQQIIKSVNVKVPGENFTIANGGLVISAKDYAKLVTAIMNGGQYAGQEIMTSNAADKMKQVWFEDEKKDIHAGLSVKFQKNMYAGHDLYYITGDDYGILSLIAYDVNTNCGVVVISSGAISYNDGFGVYSICGETAELCFKNLLADSAAPVKDASASDASPTDVQP